MGRLAALFLVSGAAALVVETTWLRWFRELFGATAPAASATLVAFFAGHALGAALAARRAPTWRRPLRAYAVLEAVAAAGALAVPVLLEAGEALTAASYDALREHPGRLTALRFALALAATLPASAALGATLPAVGAAAVREVRHLGARGSALYGWNTLGAAAGAAAAAFWLPVQLGVPGTYGLAVALQLGVAVLALAWSRRRVAPAVAGRPEIPRRRGAARASPRPLHVGPRALLCFAALSGFAALAAQVLLVDAFGQVLNQSVQAFGAVLVVVLVALAMGAAGVSRAARRGPRGPGLLLGWGLALAALAAAAFPATLYAASGGLGFLGSGSPGLSYVLRALGLAAATGGPLLLAGALVLPTCFALAGAAEPTGAPAGRAGALLGRLSAANTAGAIAGALLAPFALLPALGLWGAFGGLAAILAAGAALAPGAGPRERGLRLAVLAVGGAAVLGGAAPHSIPEVRLAPGERLVASRSTPAGVVAVIDRPDGRIVRTDNHYVLGGTAQRVHEERQGHLPLVLHPEARRVAFVGTATGITAGAATAHPVERLFLVEIVPAVTEAARTWFGDANRGVYEDPRAVPVLDDARNFLRATSERFDVVLADLFVPWRAGTGALYTREHFAAVRAHLRPDGLFCQWLPLYQLRRPELASVLRTFLEVFPRAALFRGDFYGRYPIAALVGWAGEPAPAAAVERAAARLRARGEGDRWVTDPAGVWSLYVGPLTPTAAAVRDAPLNTRAWPRVEFGAGRGHAGGGRGALDAMVGSRWLDLAERVRRAGRRTGDALYPHLGPEARRARAGGAALQAAGVHWTAGRREAAARAVERAAELLPERLFANAPADPTAADVWHALEPDAR